VLTEVVEDYWISEVILHPKVKFDPSLEVSTTALAHLHAQAQEHCFIGRSIKSKVTVVSVWPDQHPAGSVARSHAAGALWPFCSWRRRV
jgi:hypothetical protein